MDTEGVEHAPSEDVPQADGEVHTPRHQVGRIVAGVLLVGVHQAGHLALVAPQDAVWGPTWGWGKCKSVDDN